MMFPISVKGVLVVNVGTPIDSYIFEVMPSKIVFIVTYAFTLAGEFRPRLGEEHSESGVFPLNDLPGDALPTGYRQSVERSRNAGRVQPAVRPSMSPSTK